MHWIFPIIALAACTPKVAVSIESHRAVALSEPAVAVVARDRSCQPMADALVDELWQSGGLRVDPAAEHRLEVALCGNDLSLQVEQEFDGDLILKRTHASARAHALLVVRDHDVVEAHLIGTGRHRAGSESGTGPVPRRSAAELARRDVARDLVQQLAPGPMLVDRRVYPRAPTDSAKGLTTQAVQAELRGDLTEALLWAIAAHEQRPTSRTASYLFDLRRLLSASN